MKYLDKTGLDIILSLLKKYIDNGDKYAHRITFASDTDDTITNNISATLVQTGSLKITTDTIRANDGLSVYTGINNGGKTASVLLYRFPILDHSFVDAISSTSVGNVVARMKDLVSIYRQIEEDIPSLSDIREYIREWHYNEDNIGSDQGKGIGKTNTSTGEFIPAVVTPDNDNFCTVYKSWTGLHDGGLFKDGEDSWSGYRSYGITNGTVYEEMYAGNYLGYYGITAAPCKDHITFIASGGKTTDNGKTFTGVHNTYELPKETYSKSEADTRFKQPASATEAGVVKVGNGLKITSDGTLSTTYEDIKFRWSDITNTLQLIGDTSKLLRMEVYLRDGGVLKKLEPYDNNTNNAFGISVNESNTEIIVVNRYNEESKTIIL